NLSRAVRAVGRPSGPAGISGAGRAHRLFPAGRGEPGRRRRNEQRPETRDPRRGRHRRPDVYEHGSGGDRRPRRRTSRRRAAGGGVPSALPTKIGMNRFVWDLRYAGGPTAPGGDGEGGGFSGQGPLVAPGTYRARLSAGGVTRTESFVVKIDPRVAKDGVTVA